MNYLLSLNNCKFQLVVVGWGQLGTDQPISNELKQVGLRVLSSTDERCVPLLSNHDLQFCAADPMGIKGEN